MARAARTRAAGATPGFRRAVLIALSLYLGLSLYLLWRTAVLTPYADELDWIRRWYGLQSDHDWRAYLLAPVNFHRIPLTFGLIDLDIRRLGGTNLPLIGSGAVGLGLMAWVLGRQAAAAVSPPLQLAAAVTAAMLTLTAGAVLDAATPICVDYIHGAVLAVIAIVLAEGAQGRALAWRGPLALLVAMAAGLGDGAALAVWPVLALGAARRRNWAWLAAVIAAGAAYLAFYLRGQAGGAGAGALMALHHPLAAGRLALGYLLLPWARLLPAMAWIGGLVVALVALVAVWLRGGRSAGPTDRTACALILFTLATALMAALGRTGLEDPANVPLRYVVLVTPLQVGLLMLSLPWTGQLWRANRAAAQVLALVVVFGLLAQDAVMAPMAVRTSDAERDLVAGFKAGRREAGMEGAVHPDLAAAQALYARLARDGRFQHELHLKPTAPAR